MFSKSRRTVLKGLAYGSALSVSALSGLAVAKSNGQISGIGTDLTAGDIHLLPTQHAETKTISLFNHTDANVTIDGIDRLSLDGQNRFLAIKVNTPGQNGVTLTPGESREFPVATTRSNYHEIKAQNDSAFNGMIPVTVFDSQAA